MFFSHRFHLLMNISSDNNTCFCRMMLCFFKAVIRDHKHQAEACKSLPELICRTFSLFQYVFLSAFLFSLYPRCVPALPVWSRIHPAEDSCEFEVFQNKLCIIKLKVIIELHSWKVLFNGTQFYVFMQERNLPKFKSVVIKFSGNVFIFLQLCQIWKHKKQNKKNRSSWSVASLLEFSWMYVNLLTSTTMKHTVVSISEKPNCVLPSSKVFFCGFSGFY